MDKLSKIQKRILLDLGLVILLVLIYKGFSKDLNSIYLDREKVSVDFQGNNEEITVSGRMKIKNCSNETQKFYIKIKVPPLVKKI